MLTSNTVNATQTPRQSSLFSLLWQYCCFEPVLVSSGSLQLVASFASSLCLSSPDCTHERERESERERQSSCIEPFSANYIHVHVIVSMPFVHIAKTQYTCTCMCCTCTYVNGPLSKYVSWAHSTCNLRPIFHVLPTFSWPVQ